MPLAEGEGGYQVRVCLFFALGPKAEGALRALPDPNFGPTGPWLKGALSGPPQPRGPGHFVRMSPPYGGPVRF